MTAHTFGDRGQLFVVWERPLLTARRRDQIEPKELTPIERAIIEARDLSTHGFIRSGGPLIEKSPPPVVWERRPLSGEQDEALQGAIAMLRSRANHYLDSPLASQMRGEARRWNLWADILEELWEDLR